MRLPERRRSSGPVVRRNPGFTLVELLVVLAILGILVSLLVPSVFLGLDAARSTKCTAHLRKLFLAQMDYSRDHDGLLTSYWTPATPINWMLRLGPYMNDANPWDPRSAFNCPSIQGAELDLIGKAFNESYALTTAISASDWAFQMSSPPMPTQTILLGDMNVAKMETMLTSDGFRWVSGRWQSVPWGNRPGFRHHSRELAGMVFMDGHVQSLGLDPLKRDAIPNLWYWKE